MLLWGRESHRGAHLAKSANSVTLVPIASFLGVAACSSSIADCELPQSITRPDWHPAKCHPDGHNDNSRSASFPQHIPQDTINDPSVTAYRCMSIRVWSSPPCKSNPTIGSLPARCVVIPVNLVLLVFWKPRSNRCVRVKGDHLSIIEWGECDHPSLAIVLESFVRDWQSKTVVCFLTSCVDQYPVRISPNEMTNREMMLTRAAPCRFLCLLCKESVDLRNKLGDSRLSASAVHFSSANLVVWNFCVLSNLVSDLWLFVVRFKLFEYIDVYFSLGKWHILAVNECVHVSHILQRKCLVTLVQEKSESKQGSGRAAQCGSWRPDTRSWGCAS